MNILRIYNPSECNQRGVPLDWYRCRTCDGRGWIKRPGFMDTPLDADCGSCEGHGSLKAAALYAYLRYFDGYNQPELPIRCEGCGHPMSDGTWEGYAPHTGSPSLISEDLFSDAFEIIKSGGNANALIPIHFSRCDEGCRHGGPGRWRGHGHQLWAYADLGALPEYLLDGTVLSDRLSAGFTVEASWRQVQVRTLGWSHDLRAESLAVLCLRCNANREGLQ